MMKKLMFVLFVLFLAGCATTTSETLSLEEVIRGKTNYEVVYDKRDITHDKVVDSRLLDGRYYDAQGYPIGTKTIMWDPSNPDQKQLTGGYEDKLYTCTIINARASCMYVGPRGQQVPETTIAKRYGQNAKIEPISSRKIAGLNSYCFRVTLQTAVYEDCFSKDGILLYSKSSREAYMYEMTAISARRDVTLEDFAPPSELLPSPIQHLIKK